VRRYRCSDCKKTWVNKRSAGRQIWSQRLIVETVKSYVEGSGSLRVLGRRIGTTHPTIHSWVINFGKSTRNAIEIALGLGLKHRNRWSGVLYLDGKWIGRKFVLLLAVDAKTLDIVGWFLGKAETETNYIQLVDIVESCGYNIKAIVSDGEPAIISLTKPKKPRRIRKGTRPFPRPGIEPKPLREKPRLEGVPHQWCVVHAHRILKKIVNRCRKERKGILLKLVEQVLFAKTESAAQRKLKKLIGEIDFKRRDERPVANFLHTRWNWLMTHHRVRVGKRRIPRDANSIENVISYLNTRLKTMRKLKTHATAEAILNLIVLNYRFKPLDSAEKRWRKGKAPLELAGGKIEGLDWLKFSQKPTA
jgi:hypothetical protein